MLLGLLVHRQISACFMYSIPGEIMFILMTVTRAMTVSIDFCLHATNIYRTSLAKRT